MGLKNTYQARKRFTKTPVKSTGMWYQDGDVIVPSNQITMRGPQGQPNYFNSPILGVGMQSGETKVMQPGREYLFPNDASVYETKMQNGGGVELALDAASFIPGYVGMGASALGMGLNLYQGDYTGAALDAANIVTGGLAKGFKAASQTAKAAGVNRTARNMADKSKFLNKASNPNIYKSASLIRDYESNTPTNFGGYQDNTRVAPVVRPVKPKMQTGGLFPVGPYDEMMAPKKGNYLLPDINRPSYRDEEGGRRSEYKMGFNDGENEVLIPTVVGGKQLSEDEAIAQYERTGLNMGKFKTPEEAEYASKMRTAKYNMLEDPIRYQSNQFQKGGEKTPLENFERIEQVNIKSKQDPWYKRYPRMVGRAIDNKLTDFGHQYAQRISNATGGSEWYKQSNPFMNVALESMNAPQLAATYAVTGKVQTPSEAMDIQNPYGAFVVDALLDPAVAFGLGKGLVKGAPGVVKYATRTPLKESYRDSDFYRNFLQFKSRPNTNTNLNLEELRKIYHNSERILQPKELRFLHKQGHGSRDFYRTQNSIWNNPNLTPEQLNILSDIESNNNLLSRGAPTLTREQAEQMWLKSPGGTNISTTPQSNYGWGTDQWNVNNQQSTILKPKNITNKSGLTKEEAIAKASAKDKDVISKMSEQEFQETVLKPTGEVVPYYQGSLQSQFTGKNNVFALSPQQYVDEFNSRLDLLNDIITKNNKSGVEYGVKELSPDGRLTFYTPEQIIPNANRPVPQHYLDAFNKIDEPDFLYKGYEDKLYFSNMRSPGFTSKEEAKKWITDIIEKEKGTKIKKGESEWRVGLNPGQWEGDVEDIASTQYLRSIPGLEISNSTPGVFADRTPRRGTAAYESINEYLKKLNLGRVKPGFNSQTDYSRGAWENFIKSGRGVGFYSNPKTIYGTMKSAFPYIGIGTGLSQINKKKYGGLQQSYKKTKRFK
jgi:hypothetical protein